MNKVILLLIFSLASINISAQNKSKNASFNVKGNCGMCKARIEKAALDIKGVKYVSWDIPSKKLTLIFNEKKCSLKEVQKAIAKIGHDNGIEKATDSIYNALPPCCKYRDPNSIHMDHNKK